MRARTSCLKCLRSVIVLSPSRAGEGSGTLRVPRSPAIREAGGTVVAKPSRTGIPFTSAAAGRRRRPVRRSGARRRRGGFYRPGVRRGRGDGDGDGTSVRSRRSPGGESSVARDAREEREEDRRCRVSEDAGIGADAGAEERPDATPRGGVV